MSPKQSVMELGKLWMKRDQSVVGPRENCLRCDCYHFGPHRSKIPKNGQSASVSASCFCLCPTFHPPIRATAVVPGPNVGPRAFCLTRGKGEKKGGRRARRETAAGPKSALESIFLEVRATKAPWASNHFFSNGALRLRAVEVLFVWRCSPELILLPVSSFRNKGCDAHVRMESDGCSLPSKSVMRRCGSGYVGSCRIHRRRGDSGGCRVGQGPGEARVAAAPQPQPRDLIDLTAEVVLLRAKVAQLEA